MKGGRGEEEGEGGGEEGRRRRGDAQRKRAAQQEVQDFKCCSAVRVESSHLCFASNRVSGRQVWTKPKLGKTSGTEYSEGRRKLA